LRAIADERSNCGVCINLKSCFRVEKGSQLFHLRAERIRGRKPKGGKCLARFQKCLYFFWPGTNQLVFR
jgi:hypothetical protein